MEIAGSSATYCVDPDRLILESFENGGSDPTSSNKKVEIISVDQEDPVQCATFAIRQEDHTMGNLLRHVIMQNPNVEYCGYSVPHPSEAKIHLRIQTKSPDVAAAEVLDQALDTIIEMAKCTKQKYEEALATQTYEILED